MKRSVFLFMCALYFKLVISPLYVELIEYMIYQLLFLALQFH
jgi:hypothetical protein